MSIKNLFSGESQNCTERDVEAKSVRPLLDRLLEKGTPPIDDFNEIEVYFYNLSQSIDALGDLERNCYGKLRTNAAKVTLDPETSNKVFKVFEDFFGNQSWASFKDAHHAWSLIPQELKKIRFSGNHDGTTPASVFRSETVNLMQNMSQDTVVEHEADIIQFPVQTVA